MKKVTFAIILSIICFLLAIASYFLSKKVTKQYILPNPLNNQSATSRPVFCATDGCTSLGVPGTMVNYDSQTKTITVNLQDDKQYTVPLTNTVKVDATFGISYFENNWKRGDKIYVVYKIASSHDLTLDATDVYLVKTGVFAKLNLIK